MKFGLLLAILLLNLSTIITSATTNTQDSSSATNHKILITLFSQKNEVLLKIPKPPLQLGYSHIAKHCPCTNPAMHDALAFKLLSQDKRFILAHSLQQVTDPSSLQNWRFYAAILPKQKNTPPGYAWFDIKKLPQNVPSHYPKSIRRIQKIFHHNNLYNPDRTVRKPIQKR